MFGTERRLDQKDKLQGIFANICHIIKLPLRDRLADQQTNIKLFKGAN